jgi:hypothetical protein
LIAYSPTFVTQAGLGTVLVVSVSIHNAGYESFSTSPGLFSVVIGDMHYRSDDSLSDLRALNVPNGGKLIGKLAFVVPAGAASGETGNSLIYSGDGSYNVHWVEVTR